MTGEAQLTPPSPADDVARAIALNSAMISVAFEREGLKKVSLKDLALLREASIVEMSNAAGIVRKFDEEKPANPDGTRSVRLVCDDRLVAAIYTFLHYTLPPASNPHADDYLILKIRDTTHTYFLISGARENSEHADNDDEEDGAA
jgi:hypothetical protein